MKVCLINNLYKPYNRGGAERVVELMAEDYRKAGNEVIIITTRPLMVNHESALSDDKGEKVYYIPGLYYDLSKLPLILRLPWHLFDMFNIGAYFRVKNILKKEKPDFVITHNLKGVSFLIPRLIRRLGLRHAHYLHDIQLLYPSGIILFGEEKKLEGVFARLYQKLCAWLFNSPDNVESPSLWLMQTHVDRGFFRKSKKEIKEYSSLVNDVFGARGATRNAKKFLEDDNASFQLEAKKYFTFLFVGQVEKYKGIYVLIEAFKSLDNGCELVIVGGGAELERVKKIAKQVKNIIILGRKTPEEVKEIMAGADCLVMPSLAYENSPAVIYEAASASLPVIASNIGGIPELVKKYGGKLFQPGDAGDLKEKMEEAMDGSMSKV